jgi:hypothetical protein
MNTRYALRCGEIVPLGMECALPPAGRGVPRGRRGGKFARYLPFLALLVAAALAVPRAATPRDGSVITSATVASPAPGPLLCRP